jgi:alkanesulfonate monooxygenase SsuD/methylene tetrahydromethanopterin reductase-like flavin-dependent oxidoreductase (luciferase family)
MPPVIVATRSDDAVRYAATHRLGLAVAYAPVEEMAKVTDKYYQWCEAAGWRPTPDQVVHRASILLGETDRMAEERLAALTAGGLNERGLDLRASITGAVMAARNGKPFDPHQMPASGAPRAGRPQITLMGSPDTIVKQLKAFHEQCGVGVVDLGFQHAGTTHQDVMRDIELFGREVLPRIQAF